MLSAAGSPLVAGSAPLMARQTETIKVLRGFVRGTSLPPAKPDDVIDVSVADAATLIAARKAERYTRPAAPTESPAAKPAGKGA